MASSQQEMSSHEKYMIGVLKSTVRDTSDHILRSNMKMLECYYDPSYVLPRDELGYQFDPRGSVAWHAAAMKIYVDETQRRAAASIDNSAKSAHKKI